MRSAGLMDELILLIEVRKSLQFYGFFVFNSRDSSFIVSSFRNVLPFNHLSWLREIKDCLQIFLVFCFILFTKRGFFDNRSLKIVSLFAIKNPKGSLCSGSLPPKKSQQLRFAGVERLGRSREKIVSCCLQISALSAAAHFSHNSRHRHIRGRSWQTFLHFINLSRGQESTAAGRRINMLAYLLLFAPRAHHKKISSQSRKSYEARD